MTETSNSTARTLGVIMLCAPVLSAVGGRALAQATNNPSFSGPALSLNLPQSALSGAAPFGSAVRLGALPDPFAALAGTNSLAPLPSGLEVIPSIAASEQVIIGGFPKYLGINSEFVTSLTPGIRVVGVAPIGRINFNYRPSFDFYARERGDSGISQSLDGSFSTNLIPGRLTLNASAYLTQQATAGGFTPGGTAAIGPNARTTTQSYLISPTYQQNFIDLGRLNVVLSTQYTSQSGRSAAITGRQQSYFVSTDVVTQSGRLRFTTVPLMADIDDRVQVNAAHDTGTGVLNGSSQIRAEDQIRYAFRPRDLFIISAGYEDLRYRGIPPVHISDAIWSVGVQLHPRHRVEIILAYRHRYGFNAPYLRATLQLTARTSLAVSYAETLETQAQSIAANLAGSTINFGGQVVGGTGQLPILLTNNSFSVQSGLFRNRQFSIATNTEWSRDALSLSFMRMNETLVANAPGTAGFSQKGLSASANFSHQLTPNASIAAYFDYSTINSPLVRTVSNGRQKPIYAGALTGRYQLAHEIMLDLQLAVTNSLLSGFNNSSGVAGGGGVQTSITFGVQKVF